MATAATGRAIADSQQRRTRAEDSVLSSKITIPSVPEWTVLRDRITELIATGASGPLTVVTGPAGAGKTVALALWARAEPRTVPIAWVTLDRFDNRPEIFWSYVTEALRRGGVPIAPELPALAATQPDVFLHQMASALATQDPAIALILDDIHELTDAGCLDGLAYVLRNANAGLRLLVASRMDPLLPLHRYRLTGELTEIRTEDLAFTDAEAARLMAQHGVTLPPHSLAMLTRRDEGWAAGLRLAAMSMAGREDPEQYVKELATEDSAVAGYLVNEVLNAQPEDVRDVLLETSILDRVSVELAGELAGSGKPVEAIPKLARAHAFVQPIGHGWYRYHSLFADVLRLKLRHESPHKVPHLRRRAARWLWRNGTVTEAVSQATAAGDWQLAARMVIEELAVGPLLRASAGDPIAVAFKDMPAAAEFLEPPALILAAVRALRAGHDDIGAAVLDQAERLLDQVPAKDEVPARFTVALVRIDLSHRSGDLLAAAAAADRAAMLLGLMPAELLSQHPEVRTQIVSGHASGEIWAGRFEDAATMLDHVASMARDPCEWADCLGRRALLEAVQGRLRRAEKFAATASAPPGHARQGIAWHPSAAAEVALACTHLERNELRDAAGCLSRAQDALQEQPDRMIGAVAWLMVARHNLVRGRAATASEMLSRARRGWSPPPWLDENLALAESHAYAAAGDVQAALDAAERTGTPASLTRAVALACTQLAAGDSGAAAQALASAPTISASGTPVPVQLEVQLLQAEVGYRTGNPAQGRQSLARALKMAQVERNLLPIVTRRAWIEPVLRRDTGLAGAFRRLCGPGHAGDGPALAQLPAISQAAPVQVEQLTGREVEVLRHVAQMLSTAEIAGEMYLSGNTVKSHLKSIFRKLGVSHRGEAVRRAREMGLL
jgi:LuxR family transcriptional regulator, maltose regulon positive regulatory protein